MQRIYYYSFSFISHLLLVISQICIPFIKYFPSKKSNVKKILALPYYPLNWPGADRLSNWETHLKNDQLNFQVDHAWEADEMNQMINAEQNKFSFTRYKIFLKLLLKRWSTLFTLKTFDAIWIQRAYIPMFPYKKAFFESLIKRIHPNVIYDYYDADYVSNEKLVFQTISKATAITVASKFLYDKFKPLNANTKFLRYSINTNKYLIKNHNNINNSIKIGWMGSPENSLELYSVENQLKKIEQDNTNIIFSFVCREKINLKLNNLKLHSFNDKDFNYHEWLSGIDIGIIPFFTINEVNIAKIAMKSLEFMYCKIPIISSPFIHSDKLIHEESFLLAQKEEWATQLQTLIDNPELRYQIGCKGHEVFNMYHKINDKSSDDIKRILLNPLV